jgi:hypothetical protein
VATGAVAQTAENPRFITGPFYFTPTIALKEIGVDSNVLNSPEGPEDDFTWTFAPAVNGGLRIGRARLTTNATVDFVFFNEHSDQNSINQKYDVQAEGSLDRFRPYVAYEILLTRSRPGFEIDTRARRTEPLVRGGIDFRVSPRTSFGVSAQRTFSEFEEGEEFDGQELQTVLNRHEDTVGGNVRYALTPLTTLVMLVDFERTRFDFEDLRDADSYRIGPQFEFSPDALMRGRAFVGYRRFEALGSGVPDYTGVVASADLTATIRETRLEFRAERDVAYSYESVTPYYLISGFTLNAIQRLIGPLDVSGTVTYQNLSYRAVEDTIIGVDRVDRVLGAGGGIGFRLREGTRLGVVAEYAERTSNIDEALPYDRVRIYGTVTYGFR